MVIRVDGAMTWFWLAWMLGSHMTIGGPVERLNPFLCSTPSLECWELSPVADFATELKRQTSNHRLLFARRNLLKRFHHSFLTR